MCTYTIETTDVCFVTHNDGTFNRIETEATFVKSRLHITDKSIYKIPCSVYVMGFGWSSPREPAPLYQSLMSENNQWILHPGDIFLVPAPAEELVLHNQTWAHVGIFFKVKTTFFGFINGDILDITTLKKTYGYMVCRPLCCVRPLTFEKKLVEAIHRTRAILRKRPSMNLDFREGFCVGTVLAIMGLANIEDLRYGQITPGHFSKNTPFTRLSNIPYTTMYYNL